MLLKEYHVRFAASIRQYYIYITLTLVRPVIYVQMFVEYQVRVRFGIDTGV
jgi:hypothetical protein